MMGPRPFLALQNSVVLRTLPWEPLEFLTKVREIMKIYGTAEIWTQAYFLRNCCLNLTAETIYLMIKNWQRYTEEKNNDSTEWLFLLT